MPVQNSSLAYTQMHTCYEVYTFTMWIFLKPLTVSSINLSLRRWRVSSCRIIFIIGWFSSSSLVAMLLDLEISSLQLHSSTLQSFRGQVSDHHRTLSLPPIFVRAIRKTK